MFPISSGGSIGAGGIFSRNFRMPLGSPLSANAHMGAERNCFNLACSRRDYNVLYKRSCRVSGEKVIPIRIRSWDDKTVSLGLPSPDTMFDKLRGRESLFGNSPFV